MLNLKPLINPIANTERGKFDVILSNYFRTSYVFVKDLQQQIIADVFDIDVHALVPFGRFALILGSSCANALFARVDDYIGIHLTESLSISSEFGIDDVQPQFA